jgi:ABC-2 type transport system permease protein
VSAIVSDRPAEHYAQRGGPVLFSPTYLAVDLRRIFRNRRTVIFLVIMPVLFFVMFGGPYRDSNPIAFAYVMVSMAVYGAMIATTSVGASVSLERSLGWTRQLRLTPLRPVGYVLVKLVGALLVGIIPVVLVLGTGAALGANLSTSVWLQCGFAAWICSMVFAAFGLCVAYLIPAENAMQVLGPLLALLSFFGGLFVPLSQMPAVLRDMAPYMPTYAVGQIARSPITHSGLTASHVGLLVAWIVIFGIGTAVLFRRDTARA